MTTYSRFDNSQDPYTSNWAAMGLPFEPGRTAFDGPLVSVDSAESIKADLNPQKPAHTKRPSMCPQLSVRRQSQSLSQPT